MKFSELTLPEPLSAQPSFDIIDSSKLKDLMRCQRYYFFRHICGYRLDSQNHALHFGTSVHASMEHVLLNGINKTSIKEAIDIFNSIYRQHFPPETDNDYKGKNPHNFVNMLIAYATKYKDDNIKVLHTEVGGEVPITDERSLTFRIDAILERDGKKFIRDFKTSSPGFSWWDKQFRLSTQVGTYLHVAHCLYDVSEIGGFEIDGLLFQAPLKNGEIKNQLVRLTEVKSPAEMNAWLVRTLWWVHELEREFEALTEDKVENDSMLSFPQNESGCVKYNRMCEFWSICSNYPNPLQIKRTPPDFHVSFWNPTEEDSNREVKTKFEDIKK